MSSSQEDLSKMSVKVINLPFVIVFAKLYQSHKESSLSPEKKNSKSNNNNDNNNNISWLKLACSAGVFVLEFAVVSSPPYFSFQPNSHSLGRIFVSLQASSEFESKMALAWSNTQPRSPKYACIAG